jgi:AcrR family transcriptional regulator
MSPTSPTGRADGRHTRWDEHRRARRAELVEATMRAIRHHGAGVGMDQIAAQAGTSKTVVYRHFTDRAGLYMAVVAAVDELILRDLGSALTAADPGGDPRSLVAAAVDSYLRLVERDPEVYRFVVTRPLLDSPVAEDPVEGMTSRIAAQVTAVLAARLRREGRDEGAAGTWAHGLIGLVRAAADHWLGQPDRAPRDVLARQVTDLAWGGLAGALQEPDHPARPDVPEESR